MNVALFAHLLGLLTALGFPPFGIWPLTWIACSGMLWIFLSHPEKSERRTLAWAAASFSFSVNLYGFYWIAYTLREFGSLPWIVAASITLLAFAAIAVIAYVFGYGWHWVLAKCERAFRGKVPRVVVLAGWIILWNFFDLRAFPWTPAQSVGSDHWLMATVPILDTWLWSLIFLGFVSTVAHWAWRAQTVNKSFALKVLTLTIAVFVPLYGLGYWNLQRLEGEYPARQPVALLQGNVGNYQKKLTKLRVEPTVRNVLSIHRDLIEEAAIRFGDGLDATGNGPEPWLLWPETSFPGHPLQDVSAAEALKNLVSLSRGLHIVGAYEEGQILLAGVPKQVDFNIAAMFHEREGLVGRYRKHLRVPFGEYIPFDEYYPQVYQWLPGVNHFGRGVAFDALVHPDPLGPVFIPLICYEILFEGFVDQFIAEVSAKYPGRQIILVNPTNDSWYGPTSEPFQHSLLARWAAARQGVGLLRPTNTGLSQIVAPWGEALATGPRDEAWVVFGELPMKRLQPRLP